MPRSIAGRKARSSLPSSMPARIASSRFWRISSELKSELSLNELADFAHAAADICRGCRRAGHARLHSSAAGRAATAAVDGRDSAVGARIGPARARGAGIGRGGGEPHRHDPASLRCLRLRDLHRHRAQIHPRRPRAPARLLYAGRPACRASAGAGGRRADLLPQRTDPQGLRDGVVGPAAGPARRGRAARRAACAAGQHHRRGRARSAGVSRRAQDRVAAIVSRLRRACDRACGADAHAISDRIAQAVADGADRARRRRARRSLGDARLSGSAPFVGALSRRRTLGRDQRADPDGAAGARLVRSRLRRSGRLRE